eukprot:220539-Pyramimonas_sp.AAC.1
MTTFWISALLVLPCFSSPSAFSSSPCISFLLTPSSPPVLLHWGPAANRQPWFFACAEPQA